MNAESSAISAQTYDAGHKCAYNRLIRRIGVVFSPKYAKTFRPFQGLVPLRGGGIVTLIYIQTDDRKP